MVRTYNRKLGARRYVDYPPEKLETCLQAIAEGKYTVIEAAKAFDIPKKTLYNRISQQKQAKNNNVEYTPRRYGGPTWLTEEEESEVEQNLMAVADFGFPLSRNEVRFFVFDYLQKKGKSVSKFRNNIPGPDWCAGFLNRHPVLLAQMVNANKNRKADLLNDPEIVMNKLWKKMKPSKRKRQRRHSEPTIRIKHYSDAVTIVS